MASDMASIVDPFHVHAVQIIHEQQQQQQQRQQRTFMFVKSNHVTYPRAIRDSFTLIIVACASH
jgi:hypothetical protein